MSRQLTRMLILSYIVLIFASSSALVRAQTQSYANRALKTEMIDGREVAANRVIVKFRRNVSAPSRLRASLDVDQDVELGRTGARLVRSRGRTASQLVRELSARADVEYVEPDYVASGGGAPNDAQYARQWNMRLVGAEAAWGITHESPAQTIAVLDSGIDYTHPDLAANVWTAPAPFTITLGGVTIKCEAGTHGLNLITNSCDPLDDHGHGSHVSGILGATGDNDLGVAGLNWRTKLLALKWLDQDNRGFVSNAIKAIDAAIQLKQTFGPTANINVLNNSWFVDADSQALHEAVRRAVDAGPPFITIAGNGLGNNFISNDNDTTPVYPGSYPEPGLISVAATDVNDALAPFSNYGKRSVHLAAPGALVYSTFRNNSFSYYNGTSMAAPHVAGAAALLLSRCELTTAGLKGTLLSSADPLATLAGRMSSDGRLNVERALATCLANPNIIDERKFYVRQHYVDFLNREPDAAGQSFWVDQIASCNAEPLCADVKRQNVSAAYFLSREFQETGFFVITIHRAAFGRISVDAALRINYAQFTADAGAVGRGFLDDGSASSNALLDGNKSAYAQAIVASPAFAAKYPDSLTVPQYIDALFATAAVTPTEAEREEAITAGVNGSEAGRAAALRKVAETSTLKGAEFRSAFVLLQYFGYLRRNPTDPPNSDDSGYQFWLGKLNFFNGDYIRSEMVRSFIVSEEYRKRFGPG